MLIILCLYAVALWAIFSRFKLVRWGWASGSVAVLVGLLILATFLALFNYLTPSGCGARVSNAMRERFATMRLTKLSCAI